MCVGRGIDTDQHKANPAAVVLFRNLVVPDTNHLIARVLANGLGGNVYWSKAVNPHNIIVICCCWMLQQFVVYAVSSLSSFETVLRQPQKLLREQRKSDLPLTSDGLLREQS